MKLSTPMMAPGRVTAEVKSSVRSLPAPVMPGASVSDAPVRLVFPVRTSGLEKIRAPGVERSRSPPAVVGLVVTVRSPVVSLSVNAPFVVKAPRSATVFNWFRDAVVAALPVSVPVVLSTPAVWLIACPEVSVTVPLLPFTLPASVMSLAPVVTNVTPAPATLPVVTARLPPVVVMLARPLFVVVTAPVTFRPAVVSLSVNEPLVVNAPRLETELLLANATVPAVLPVRIFTSSTVPGFCETAAVIFAAVPTFSVPPAAVTLPSATVVAFWTFTADADALVVVKVPVAKSTAPPPPLMEMVPLPELMVVPASCVTPPEPAAMFTLPTPAVVRFAPMFTPPVPPFTLSKTPPFNWPPAVVSRAALIEIPPVFVTVPPGSFATKTSAPPRVVIAPFTVMPFPACSVRPCPFPELAEASIALVIVISFLAARVTDVVSRRPTIREGSMVELAAGSSVK